MEDPMKPPIVRAQSLSQHFQVRGTSPSTLEVVDSLTFDVTSGSIVSLVGPSGCGKSTILELIAGLQSSSGGLLEVNTSSLAMVFQDYAIFLWMTVIGNLRYVFSL